MKRTTLLMALCLSVLGADAQPWSIDGNTGLDPVDNYIGSNLNDPLNFRTDSIFRMRLNQTGISTINTFPVPNSGFLGISARPAFFTGTPGPFSRLHLVDSIGANDPIIYAQLGSFRPWQRNGVTFTGNADHGYVGQKYNTLDRTDMVVHWGNDPGPTQFAPDYLRFIFTGGYDSTRQTGARSLEGAEGMRLYPVNDSSIFVGVGDFFKASVDNGFAVRPNERLDVLDGRVRIRHLPDDPAAVDSFLVMVVDNTVTSSGNQERGVVKWVDPSIFTTPASSDCDWNIQNEGVSGSTIPHNMWTAFGASNLCPDGSDHVGIGTNVPTAGKLTVSETASTGSSESTIHVTMKADEGLSNGVFVRNNPATGVTSETVQGVSIQVSNGIGLQNNTAAAAATGTIGLRAQADFDLSYQYTHVLGLWGTARTSGSVDELVGVKGIGDAEEGGARNVFGTNGSVTGSTTTTNLFGAFGRAEGEGDIGYGVKGEARDYDDVLERYGVHGTVQGLATAADFQCGVYGKAPVLYNEGNDLGSWAGYFQGIVRVSSNAYVNGNVLVTSDADLKTNVEEIPDALGLLNALAPKSYEFIPQDHPHLQMPEGRQWGLLAQELREVLPELVKEVPVPAEYDSTGVLVAPSTSHLAVNYIGLIPILIAAVQEQQGQLAQASATETELEDRLAAQEARADELAARLDQLEQALALCCSNPDRSESPLAPEGDLKLDPATERLLRIDPNPFTDRTTIRYTLERGGRTMLLVNSGDGKQLDVLQEALLPAGEHQQEWHTDHLAPGVYYVTLLLDGEPLVKRAVKVR